MACSDHYPDIPSELKRRPQWVVWRYERSPLDGSGSGSRAAGETRAKVPYSPLTGKRASTTDPSTWAAYAQCSSHQRIGYVFSADDPYAGIDLDDCLDPDTGEVGRVAGVVLGYLGTYAEVSPSGRGVKLVARGRLPEGRRQSRTLGIEMYDEKRFFALTGERLSRPYSEIREVDLEPLHRWCFGPPPPPTVSDSEEKTESPRFSPRSRCSDAEVLGKARSAANADKFEALFDGDTSGYATHSEADLALCAMLAYWTDRDASKVEELFSLSGLVREKWTARADYRRRTIRRAIASLPEQAGRKKRVRPTSKTIPGSPSCGA